MIKYGFGFYQVFKEQIHPRQLDIQVLNQQARDLTKDSPTEQTSPIKDDLAQVNNKWDNLLDNMAERKVGN